MRNRLLGVAVLLALLLGTTFAGQPQSAQACGTATTPDCGPNYQVTLQNAATATGNGTTAYVNGIPTVGIQITGTFVATIDFEANVDGTNWVSVQANNFATGVVSNIATSSGLYIVTTAGLVQLRARIASYTSGTITATADLQYVSGGFAGVGHYFYTHHAANSSINEKNGSGVLHAVTINTKGAASNVCGVYDSVGAGAGATVIGTIDTTATVTTLVYDVGFNTGLTTACITGTAGDLTVAWR